MRRAAIGISAHLGWAATATVRVGKKGVEVLRSDRLEIAGPDDRETREPYHVAGGFEGLGRVPQPPDPERSLREGLARQRRAAARVVGRLAAALEADGKRLAFAGLLVSRGRAAPSFEKAIGSHTQIHVEEGIAVRESFQRALEELGARVVRLDRKALAAEAAETLGRSHAALLAELREQRPGQGDAWRKEEQSAALAAWLAWVRAAGR
jgi:hypothetical protein